MNEPKISKHTNACSGSKGLPCDCIVLNDQLPMGLYQHYKGGIYLVLGIAQHTETKENMVVYVSMEMRPGPRMRARPVYGAEGFMDSYRDENGITKGPRFVYLGHQVPEEDLTKL